MEPAALRAHAQAAEALGYDLIVLPDHLVLEGPERQFDPHSLAYDMIVIAAVLAEATKKIRIGHLVLCNLFRHPAITAQALMTLDRVSGGRLLAGVVLDEGGNLKAFARMDGAPILGIEGCQRKAFTALYGLGTEALYQRIKDDPSRLIGLGVGGGTVEQDVACAQAGLDVLNAK
jgi:uncharacterized protein GlcG (DUF336 family)